MIVVSILAVGFLAAANRVRGGFGGDEIRHEIGMWWRGRVASTLSWGVPFGLVAWSVMPWWLAVLAGVGAAVGCAAGQGGLLGFLPWTWSGWAPEPLRSCLFGKLSGLSMGHRPGGSVGVAAWVGMGLWGIQRVALPCMALWWYGFQPWGLLAAGAVTPLVYAAVWFVPAALLFTGAGRGSGQSDPPELAEWIWGGLAAIGLIVAA
jgi:hypothetical protein